jgi:membrane-associated phospholipid phosphatase
MTARRNHREMGKGTMDPGKRVAAGAAFVASAACLSLVTPSDALADPPAAQGPYFTVNPVADGVLTAAGAGFSGLLGLILSTGEIQATTPGPTSNLLPIDRGAVTQTFDKGAGTISDVILWSAAGFAALDPILSGLRYGWDAALVDAVMYAESLSLTETLTDLTKIAVRRPRPLDYKNCPIQDATCPQPTDSVLSFWSGHTATVASVAATATYIAFIRAPRSPRPWITMAAGLLLTAFVGYERVRSGEHFPTDVLAGAMAGAAIGVLVPHSHRSQQQPPAVWVGFAPTDGGGSVDLHGVF